MLDEKQSPTRESQASLNGHEQSTQVTDSKRLDDIHDEMKVPLKHIDLADPTKIQCVASANLELNDKYHKIILQQANMSFRFATYTAGLGFALFCLAVFFFMQHLTDFALISTAGSAITAILLGTTFYLYRHSLNYFDEIHRCLARTELLLLGNSLCMQIDENDKEKRAAAYLELIRNVTQLTVLLSEGEHKRIRKANRESGLTAKLEENTNNSSQ